MVFLTEILKGEQKLTLLCLQTNLLQLCEYGTLRPETEPSKSCFEVQVSKDSKLWHHYLGFRGTK